eukprot:scaffold8199_cov888-Pinguiococcus_pyrenoidosus.AAC.1
MDRFLAKGGTSEQALRRIRAKRSQAESLALLESDRAYKKQRRLDVAATVANAAVPTGQLTWQKHRCP